MDNYGISQAPPGVPAGMVPPKVQILTTRASNSEGINGMEGRAGEEKSVSPFPSHFERSHCVASASFRKDKLKIRCNES